MPKSKKRGKRKPKRKYGQQDKVVFKRVRREEKQTVKPPTLKDRLVVMRERQQAAQESAERVKEIKEKIIPPNMSYADYMGYLDKKKKEAKEKGAYFRY